jgi:hypothetical protein
MFKNEDSQIYEVFTESKLHLSTNGGLLLKIWYIKDQINNINDTSYHYKEYALVEPQRR